MVDLDRRAALALGGAFALAATAGEANAASSDPIELALLTPLSGPWGEQGVLERAGARLAIEDVNNAGGIKALGGRKLKLNVLNTGSSVSSARAAAENMVSKYPNLVGGIGCWLSTFTLAATEVTEKAKLPWLTLSYSQHITDRGFKYVFQTAPTAAKQSEQLIPLLLKIGEKSSGKKPTRLAVIADNTASNTSFLEPLDRIVKAHGLHLVEKKIYSPPLTSADDLVRPARARGAELVVMAVSSDSDVKLLLDTFREYGMPPTKVPMCGDGGDWSSPTLLKSAGSEVLEGVLAGNGNWPGRSLENLSARFVKQTGLPWFGQNSLFSYAHVKIFAWALNHAKKANRQAVAETIRNMNIRNGPAKYYPNKHIQFDKKGRLVDAEMAIVQWRKGKPVAVFPEQIAVEKALWPSSS